MVKVVIIGTAGLGLSGMLQTLAIAQSSAEIVVGDSEPVALIVPDYLDERRTLLKNDESEPVGYTYPDPLDSRRTLLKDSNGKTKGYFKRDILDKRRVIFTRVREKK